MPLPLAAIGIGAGLKFLGGVLGGAKAAKDAKMKALNDQKMAQYKINMKQKGLNRKSLNFASLLKALGREGWFGDPNAEGSFMKTKGSFNAADWNYDPVPLGATPGVFSSALGGGLRGGVQGVEDWYMNEQAAGREASGQINAPRSSGQPTGFTSDTSGIQFNPYGSPTDYEDFN